MSWLRSLRRVLRRLPLLWWVTATALALVTGTVVARSVSSASALARQYGPLEPMVVATGPLAFGDVVEADHLAVAWVPASLVPADHLSDPGELVGSAALGPVVAGQPVVAAHLGPAGVRGVAALLPPGTRAVAVSLGGASAPVAVGDRVDVLATFDPSLVPATEATMAVAVGALVVAVDADAATVAVDPAEAVAVAFSASHGALTLALAPPLEAGGYPLPTAAPWARRAATPSTTTPEATR